MSQSKPFDTIGIVNFILWVPITLVICLVLLKFQEILKYIQKIISFAQEYEVYFIALIITIILIFVSIALYITSIYQLQQSYMVGNRMQEECKNIYTIHNTGNYQLYKTLIDPSISNPIKVINVSCLLLYIIIGLTFISISLNNFTLYTWKSKQFAYPLFGLLFVVIGILSIYTNISQPTYIQEIQQSTQKPWIIFLAYLFVSVCYLIQLFKTDRSITVQPFNVILLVISALALGLIFLTQNSDLNTNALQNYISLTHNCDDNKSNKKTKSNEPIYKSICADINTIGIADAKINGTKLTQLKQFSDIPYPPNTPFTKYLMENIKAVPQWKNINPPDTEPLWPYALNEANGMELNSFYIDTDPLIFQKAIKDEIKKLSALDKEITTAISSLKSSKIIPVNDLTSLQKNVDSFENNILTLDSTLNSSTIITINDNISTLIVIINDMIESVKKLSPRTIPIAETRTGTVDGFVFKFTEKLNIAKTALETLRKSMNTTQNNPQGANILQFRKDMSNLRSYTGFSDSLDNLSKYGYVLILLLTTLLIYPIFNLLYKNDPIFITYIVGIILIVILCLACVIGFISKLLT